MNPFNTLIPLIFRGYSFLRLLVLSLAFAPLAEAATQREFNDAFTGTSLSSSWSTTEGGTSGSSTTVNNGLSLATTGASSYRWICSSWTNYSLGTSTYGNPPLLLQATMGAPTWPSTKTGSGFSIFLASGTGSAPSTSTVNPGYTASSILELRYTVNSSGTSGTLALYGKTASANTTQTLLDTIGTSLTLTPQTVSMGLSNMNGSVYVTVSYGNASPTQAPTSTVSYTLGSAYVTAFQGGQAVYLYVMGESGTGGGLTMAINQVSASSGFVDNFGGSALSQNNWSTYSYGGTGPGDGGSGSITSVAPGALTLNANASTRWIALAPTNYSFVDNTQTFQTTLSTSNSTVNSTVSIILTSTAPGAWTNPVTAASNALEVRFTVTNTNDLFGELELYGKLSGGSETLITDPNAADTNDLKITHLPFSTTSTNRGASTIGVTLNNSAGTSGTTTVTIYYNNGTTYEPVSETIVLPSTYATAFGTNPVYAYVMAGAASSSTQSAAFSQFTTVTQPTLSATVVVNEATQLQNLSFGGDYAKGSTSDETLSSALDNSGQYALTNLSPTWARVGLPLYQWEPAQQTINSTTLPGLLTGPSGYFYEQDMNNPTSNLHYILERIKALSSSGGEGGSVTNFIISVWQLPTWMTSPDGFGDGNFIIPTAQQTNVLAGIASFLMYAHTNYGLDLTHTYISFNEPDIATEQYILATDYAKMIVASEGTNGTSGLFNTLGLTNVSGMPSTIPWIAGETGSTQGYTSTQLTSLAGNPVPALNNGTVIYNGYAGSYTDNVLTALKSDELGTLTTSNVAIGFHSYDDISPVLMSYVAEASAHYGIPVICDEVGVDQYYDSACDGSDPTAWQNYAPQTWDNAWKLADDSQKVINDAGASANLVYSYMNDRGIINNTTSDPYPSFYPLQQMAQGFLNMALLSSTPYGQIDAMAGGHANNPHTVQILQPDSRPLNIRVTGLYPTSIGAFATYKVYWTNYTTSKSTGPTGGSVLLGTYTADSTGSITINVPAAPVESLNDGSGLVYWDSGSAIIVTDLTAVSF